MKMCYERSFFQHCVKNDPKGCSCVLSSRKRCSSSGGSYSPVFRQEQIWSCTSCSVFTWPHTKRLLAVSNTEGHNSWSHNFKSFRSCNSDLPVVTTNPKEAFAVAMQSWRQRCEKLVSLQIDYVEKWQNFQFQRMNNFFNKLGDLRTWVNHVKHDIGTSGWLNTAGLNREVFMTGDG